jgi:hypothetical protein
MSSSSLRYASPDSRQTLREGLDEYYANEPGLLEPAQLSLEAAQLFRQHDAAHVVFGCDTSLRGETLIDTWTIFGTTIGLRGYLEYLKLPQVNALFAKTGAPRIALELMRCAGDVVRVVVRSRRLRRKWPWRSWAEHLDEPLADIRTRFNIQVL